jgi:hypothetical protein
MAREQAPHQHFSGFVNFSSTNLPRVLTGAAPLSNTLAARARLSGASRSTRSAFGRWMDKHNADWVNARAHGEVRNRLGSDQIVPVFNVGCCTPSFAQNGS